MKTTIAFLSMLTLSCAAFAKATTADRSSLFMISDVIKTCPAEFTKALEKEESILGLSREYSQNSQGRSVTTLIMTTGYAATPMNPDDLIRNTVTVVKTAKAVQPMDGWLEDSVCTLKNGNE